MFSSRRVFEIVCEAIDNEVVARIAVEVALSSAQGEVQSLKVEKEELQAEVARLQGDLK